MISENDNQEVLYCDDNGEYRVYSNTCYKLCTERFRKNYWKPQNHTNFIHNGEQLKK